MDDVTRLLERAGAGDDRARDELARVLYDELHARASAQMKFAQGHTLQPTALVHEAWCRIAGSEDGLESRGHFLAIATRAMRSVLVDHARKRGTVKRGGGAEREQIDASVEAFEERAVDLLALDEALVQLTEFDPLAARVVELRFFGGVDHPEIARITNTPLRTVERKWQLARGWLRFRLDP